jgi:hypothetical protein
MAVDARMTTPGLVPAEAITAALPEVSAILCPEALAALGPERSAETAERITRRILEAAAPAILRHAAAVPDGIVTHTTGELTPGLLEQFKRDFLAATGPPSVLPGDTTTERAAVIAEAVLEACDAERDRLQACPTPCDPDCEQACHEVHDIPSKRDHDPEECRARIIAEAVAEAIAAEQGRIRKGVTTVAASLLNAQQTALTAVLNLVGQPAELPAETERITP